MTVEVSTREGAAVLVIGGEVDVHSAAGLREAVLEAEVDATTLAFDLAGLTFMDSSGLGVLVGALARGREAGRRVVLCAVPDRLMRLLTLTGLDHQFELAPSTEAALSAG